MRGCSSKTVISLVMSISIQRDKAYIRGMEKTPNAKPIYKKKWFIFLSIFVILAIIGTFSAEDETVQKETFVPVSMVTLNAGFDEDANEWFYGANFKADAPENTKLDCNITALDKSGIELTSYQATHNVTKSGIAVLYGETVLPSAEESIVKAITSFDVKCKKA